MLNAKAVPAMPEKPPPVSFPAAQELRRMCALPFPMKIADSHGGCGRASLPGGGQSGMCRVILILQTAVAGHVTITRPA